MCKGAALLRASLLLLLAANLAAQESDAEPPTRGQVYSLEEQAKVSDEDLRQRFSPDQLAILEKLNRADITRLRRLPEVVVPERWLEDELDYSPLPLSYAWASQYPKALVVHLPSQVFGAYEYGRLVRWGPISSGRETDPTPSGLFHLQWRSKGRHSSIDPDWYMPWYFNFDTKRGLAFHQYRLPGMPASHACVRLLERDAKWLYEWGEARMPDRRRRRQVAGPGTPVLIVGQYRFDSLPPWRSLDWLAVGAVLPEMKPPEEEVEAGPGRRESRPGGFR